MKAYEVKVHFEETLNDYTLIVPWMAGFSIAEVLADTLEKDELASFNVKVIEV